MYPELFRIGSFPVHSFGVMMVLAFFAGLLIARKRASRYGVAQNELTDLVFWVLIFGILGARLLFIVQEWGYFSKNPRELFSLQFAGLTSFGGILAGILVIVFFAKKRNRPVVAYLDLLAPGMLIGQAVGRLGCLLNGCCLGGVCPPGLVWGVRSAEYERAHPGSILHFHPAQVYEALMLVGMLVLLLWLEKRGLRRGQVYALGLFFLGLARFIYEFWRAGTEAQVKAGLASSTYWGSLPITQAQGVAGLMVLAGALAYVLYARGPASPEPAAA